MNIIMIAALSENNVIGKDGGLPWNNLKDDMRLFSNLTKNQAVLMGRKNYESIGKPLPNRYNIVMSRNRDYEAKGCATVDSVETAIELIRDSGVNLFVIGGADIYKLAMPLCTHYFETRVHAEVDGDVFFPEHYLTEWPVYYSAKYDKNDDNDHAFTFSMRRYWDL